MAIGGMILTGFGAVWCLLGLGGWVGRPGWAMAAGGVVGVALLAGCGWRLWQARGLRDEDDPVAAAAGKRAGMWFGVIFGVEGAAIGVCSALLARHGLGEWIAVAAAGIVGLHFLPLARVFGVGLYYWTGGLATLGALGGALIADAGVRDLFVGLMMAGVLWGTVGILLMRLGGDAVGRPVRVWGAR
jgi:hypothetical protein